MRSRGVDPDEPEASEASGPRSGSGGVWVDASDLDRAGGLGAFHRHVRDAMLGAS